MIDPNQGLFKSPGFETPGLFSFPLTPEAEIKLAEMREEHKVASTYKMPSWEYGNAFSTAHTYLALDQAIKEKQGDRDFSDIWQREVSNRGITAAEWIKNNPEELREQISFLMSQTIESNYRDLENQLVDDSLTTEKDTYFSGMSGDFDDMKYPIKGSVDLTSEDRPNGIETIFGNVTEGSYDIGSWSSFLDDEGANMLSSILRRRRLKDGRFSGDIEKSTSAAVTSTIPDTDLSPLFLEKSNSFYYTIDSALGLTKPTRYSSRRTLDRGTQEYDDEMKRRGYNPNALVFTEEGEKQLLLWSQTLNDKSIPQDKWRAHKASIESEIATQYPTLSQKEVKDLYTELKMWGSSGASMGRSKSVWIKLGRSYATLISSQVPVRDDPAADQDINLAEYVDTIMEKVALRNSILSGKGKASEPIEVSIQAVMKDMSKNGEFPEGFQLLWDDYDDTYLKQGMDNMLSTYPLPVWDTDSNVKKDIDSVIYALKDATEKARQQGLETEEFKRLMGVQPIDRPAELEKIEAEDRQRGEEIAAYSEEEGELLSMDREMAELLSPGSMDQYGPTLFSELTDTQVTSDVFNFSRLFAGGVTSKLEWNLNFNTEIGLKANIDTAATLRKIVLSIADRDNKGKPIIDQRVITNIMTALYGYGSAYPTDKTNAKAMYATVTDYSDPRWEQGLRDAIDFAVNTAPEIERIINLKNNPLLAWEETMVEEYKVNFPDMTFNNIDDVENLVVDVAWRHKDYGVRKNYKIMRLYNDLKKAGAAFYEEASGASALHKALLSSQSHWATGTSAAPGASIYNGVWYADNTLIGNEHTPAGQALIQHNMGALGKIWRDTAVSLWGEDATNKAGYTTPFLPSHLFDIQNRTMRFEEIRNPLEAQLVTTFIVNALHGKQVKGDLRVITDLRTYIKDGLTFSNDASSFGEGTDNHSKRQRVWMAVASLIQFSGLMGRDATKRDVILNQILGAKDKEERDMYETVGLWLAVQQDARTSMDNAWTDISNGKEFSAWVSTLESHTNKLLDYMSSVVSGRVDPDSKGINPMFGFNTTDLYANLEHFGPDDLGGWGFFKDSKLLNWMQGQGDLPGSWDSYVSTALRSGIVIPPIGDDSMWSDEYRFQSANKQLEAMWKAGMLHFFTEETYNQLKDNNLAPYGLARALQVHLSDNDTRRYASAIMLADIYNDDGLKSPLELLTTLKIINHSKFKKDSRKHHLQIVGLTEDGEQIVVPSNMKGIINYAQDYRGDTTDLLPFTSELWTGATPYQHPSQYITLDPVPDAATLAGHPGHDDGRFSLSKEAPPILGGGPPALAIMYDYTIGSVVEYFKWLGGSYDNEYEEEIDLISKENNDSFKNMMLRNFTQEEGWGPTYRSLGFNSQEEWSQWFTDEVLVPYVADVKTAEDNGWLTGINSPSIEDMHFNVLDRLMKKIQTGGGRLGNAQPDFNLFGLRGMLGGEKIGNEHTDDLFTDLYKYGRNTTLSLNNASMSDLTREGAQSSMTLTLLNRTVDGTIGGNITLPWTITDNDFPLESLPAHRGWHPWEQGGQKEDEEIEIHIKDLLKVPELEWDETMEPISDVNRLLEESMNESFPAVNGDVLGVMPMPKGFKTHEIEVRTLDKLYSSQEQTAEPSEATSIYFAAKKDNPLKFVVGEPGDGTPTLIDQILEYSELDIWEKNVGYFPEPSNEKTAAKLAEIKETANAMDEKVTEYRNNVFQPAYAEYSRIYLDRQESGRTIHMDSEPELTELQKQYIEEERDGKYGRIIPGKEASWHQICDKNDPRRCSVRIFRDPEYNKIYQEWSLSPYKAHAELLDMQNHILKMQSEVENYIGGCGTDSVVCKEFSSEEGQHYINTDIVRPKRMKLKEFPSIHPLEWMRSILEFTTEEYYNNYPMLTEMVNALPNETPEEKERRVIFSQAWGNYSPAEDYPPLYVVPLPESLFRSTEQGGRNVSQSKVARPSYTSNVGPNYPRPLPEESMGFALDQRRIFTEMSRPFETPPDEDLLSQLSPTGGRIKKYPINYPTDYYEDTPIKETEVEIGLVPGKADYLAFVEAGVLGGKRWDDPSRGGPRYGESYGPEHYRGGKSANTPTYIMMLPNVPGTEELVGTFNQPDGEWEQTFNLPFGIGFHEGFHVMQEMDYGIRENNFWSSDPDQQRKDYFENPREWGAYTATALVNYRDMLGVKPGERIDIEGFFEYLMEILGTGKDPATGQEGMHTEYILPAIESMREMINSSWQETPEGEKTNPYLDIFEHMFTNTDELESQGRLLKTQAEPNRDETPQSGAHPSMLTAITQTALAHPGVYHELGVTEEEYETLQKKEWASHYEYLKKVEGSILKPANLFGEPHKTVGIGHYLDGSAYDRKVVKEALPKVDYEKLRTGQISLDDDQALALFKVDAREKYQLARRITTGFDTYSNNLKTQLLSATFRGSWVYSDKARGLLAQGKFKESADEFLDSQEYRDALKPDSKEPGVAPRMEAVAKAIRDEEIYEEKESN